MHRSWFWTSKRPPLLKSWIQHCKSKFISQHTVYSEQISFVPSFCSPILSCTGTCNMYVYMHKWHYPGTQRFPRSRMSMRLRSETWEKLGTHVRSFEHANPIRSRYWGFWVRFWLGNYKWLLIGSLHSKDLMCVSRGSLALHLFTHLFASRFWAREF